MASMGSNRIHTMMVPGREAMMGMAAGAMEDMGALLQEAAEVSAKLARMRINYDR